MNNLFNSYPQLQNNYYQIQSSITLLYNSFLDNHAFLLNIIKVKSYNNTPIII